MKQLRLGLTVVVLGVLLGLGTGALVDAGQGTLSSQVLRLLSRANTWSAIQTFQTPPVHTPLTYATLPAMPVAGTVTAITDAMTNTWGAVVSAGGGSNEILIWYNGTAWTCLGK